MSKHDPSMAYVRLRLANPSLGTREAARRAGFAAGVPSARARRLHEKAIIALDLPEVQEAAHAELQVLEEQMSALREEVAQKQEWLMVCEIV